MPSSPAPPPADRKLWTWSVSRPAWERVCLSGNPDKAWSEKWFLTYSLVWPPLFGLWSWSGLHLHARDEGNMLVTVLLACPFLLVPYWYAPRGAMPGKAFANSYAFKFSVWMAIFSFMASYFFSEYFFDVLGMKYVFPHLSWNLDSVLVGQGTQRVPLMMYIHAWYFFMTYHTGGVCFSRAMCNLAMSTGAVPVEVASVVGTFLGAMFFAVGEIYFTTMDAIKDQFAYRDMDWALTWGGLAYACYFVVSFPMVKDMDESGFVFWDRAKHFDYKTSHRLPPTQPWTLPFTVQNALAASSLSFLLLDVVCQFVLPDTWLVRVRGGGWWVG